MKDFYGVILIDGSEVILRVYQIDDKKWQLFYYTSRDLVDKKREKNINAYDIAEIVADLFSTTHVQTVIEWKIFSRKITREIAAEIALALGLKIEHLENRREQELICKGAFTELW